MLQMRGIKPLNYPRTKLVQILKENREKHVKAFEEADKLYKEALVKSAEEMLERVKDGDDSQTRLDVVKPVNNAHHYDRAISMFELATEQDIELEQEVFSQLVLDQWDWKDQIAHAMVSNSKYSARSSL